MIKTVSVGTIVLLGVLISTVGAEPVAAQGPAGAGAAAVAQDSAHSLRSLNPVTWVKKDPKNSSDAPEARSDAERKLTPILQTEGILAANTTMTDACAPFIALEACLAALHASHNLGLDFNCIRAVSTGVHTSADVSGCKAADGEKAQGLATAIHQLKPDANSKQATKEAEQQAKDDLKGIGG